MNASWKIKHAKFVHPLLFNGCALGATKTMDSEN
jgi:hypothetical protein